MELDQNEPYLGMENCWDGDSNSDTANDLDQGHWIGDTNYCHLDKQHLYWHLALGILDLELQDMEHTLEL